MIRRYRAGEFTDVVDNDRSRPALDLCLARGQLQPVELQLRVPADRLDLAHGRLGVVPPDRAAWNHRKPQTAHTGISELAQLLYADIVANHRNATRGITPELCHAVERAAVVEAVGRRLDN